MARIATEPPAVSSSRRNRDVEIMDAATSVFSHKGYSGASLQEIADKVGILKGSLYHYIDSKESLLFRILDGSHTSAMEIMVEVDALGLATEQKFLTYVEKVVLWYLQHLDRAGLYQNEWRFLEGEFAQQVRSHRRNTVDSREHEARCCLDVEIFRCKPFAHSRIDHRARSLVIFPITTARLPPTAGHALG